jgi:hypothetical protein
MPPLPTFRPGATRLAKLPSPRLRGLQGVPGCAVGQARANLVIAADKRRRLLEAVLAEALVPAGDREPAAAE